MVLRGLWVTSFIRSPDTDHLCLDKHLGVMFCNPWCGVHTPALHGPQRSRPAHMCRVLELEPCQGQGPQAEQVPIGRTRAGARPEWCFSSLLVVGTSLGSATVEAAPNAVTF
jgi:hypothetical protein